MTPGRCIKLCAGRAGDGDWDLSWVLRHARVAEGLGLTLVPMGRHIAAGTGGLVRGAWLWLALVVLIAAGASIAWLNGRHAPPSAAIKPTEAGLLRASGLPLVTAPIVVPGGYEAAAWNKTDRVTFWKWTTAGRKWDQLGASTYPDLHLPFATSHTTITGALLTGMSDATFIARGFFSGDGTGNYIAFTNGPRGWGTIAPGPDDTLIATGNKSTDNTTPGNSFTELFHGGDLEISEPSELPFGPDGEEWQVERTYAWSAGQFHQVSTTQFTAALASPPPATAPPFPAASCHSTPSGTYKSLAVSATTTFASGLSRPYLPTSVVLHVQGAGAVAGCDFTVGPDFPIVISAATASGTAWVTAPAWVLTGANGIRDIRDLLPGTQLPGQDGLGALEFQDPVFSPYYIPKSLGISQIGQFGSPVLSIDHGQLAALTLLPS
jgi:hypothetical protein